MANRIAGITVEIGGDTTKLQTALKSVNSEIKSTQAQLRDVNSLLKLDPTNTTLLAQKQKLLTDAISETKEKLKSLADQAAEPNAALVKIGDAGEKLQSVGDSISGVGTKLLGVTTAVVALGAAAVTTTADFETAMSKVKSLLSSSSTDLEGDMERLEEAAREAGETTKFSATEAAEAMSYMGLAGWSADEMIQGLDGILNLAAASEMDLATASDIVTDYLSAFGLTAADSGTLVDKMAYAMSNSNTSTAQLGEAYKNCAATATQLGYGLDETTAALMVMADAGIKGGEAGTALSSIMARLGNNTSGCTDMLADYGIEVYDTEGNVNSLSNILSGMQGIWADLTDEQRANLAYVVAGKTAQSELMTVLGETTGSFQAYQEGLAGCSGTAENMAEIMQDNLSGQLTILKSQLQELAISFGEILMPTIKSIVSWIQNLVDKLNNMDEGTREAIVKVGLLAAAIGPLLIVIGKTISTVGTAMKGFSSLGTSILKIVNHAKTGTGMIGKLVTAIGGISAPVTAVVAVIGVLVAAFVTLWNTNDEFREKIISIWDGLVSKITEFVDGIKERFADLGINLGSLGDVVETLKDIWLGFCNLLAPVFEGAFSLVSAVLSTGLDAILALLDIFIGIFTGDWEQAWNGVKEFFAAAWELIASIFQTAANNLSGILSALKGTVLEKLSGIKDSVKSVFSELVSGALSWGKDLIANFITGITSKIQSLKDSVSSVASMIRSYIGFSLPETGPLADADTYMPDFMELMADGIRNNLSGVLSSVKSMAVGINDSTRGALTASDSSDFGDSLRSVAADVINAFSSAQSNAGLGRIELTVNLGGAQVAKQIYRLYNEASEVRGGALV